MFFFVFLDMKKNFHSQTNTHTHTDTNKYKQKKNPSGVLFKQQTKSQTNNLEINVFFLVNHFNFYSLNIFFCVCL